MDIELFLQEKLNPIHRAWYAVWVYWWPLWRTLYSGPKIQQQWGRFNLVAEGQAFLDYGCGTGYFSFLAATIVGTEGKVYALDCFPRQLEIVGKRAKENGLPNIETILSDSKTGLPDECIDVVWMCDVFHELKEKQAALEELHRVLKRDGTLAIYDGMQDRILDYTGGLFSLSERDNKLFKFLKKG